MSPQTDNCILIAPNSKVKIHFCLSTEDLILESTEGQAPFALTVGEGKLHPAIENLLIGHKAGDQISQWIDASLAFGDYDQQFRIRISKKKLPEKVRNLEEGMSFETLGPDKKLRLFRILESNEQFIVMDGNHPLAGENLLFEATVLEVSSAYPQ